MIAFLILLQSVASTSISFADDRIDSLVSTGAEMKKVERLAKRKYGQSAQYRTWDNSFDADLLWAKRLPENVGHWYRGMFLDPDGEELQILVTKGLQVKKSFYKEIWFSRDPIEAIGYIQSTFRTGLDSEDPKIRVLLKMKRGSIQDVPSTKDIPASAISEIYIFDKNGPVNFPFQKFTVGELARLLARGECGRYLQ